MTKIIVDSTCDLPKEFCIENDVISIPLRVHLGDKDYKDKKDIEVEEVFEKMRAGILPKTSQPALEDIYETFICQVSKGHDIIYLAFSSELSGTYQAAKLVAEEVKEKYPDVKIEVIDSKAGSIAIGLMVMDAIKCIELGESYEEVVKRLNFMTQHVEHVFTLTDLNWLVKGGRLTKTQGVLGNMLNVKPIIDIQDGKMQVIQKVRGKNKVLNEVVRLVEERSKDYKDQVLGVAYAEDSELADQIIERLLKKDENIETIKVYIGGVLASHLGLGGVGICFFNKAYTPDA